MYFLHVMGDEKHKQPVILSQVECATICCPWRTGKTWEKAADPDAKSTTTASLFLEAPSHSPAATSTPRYQAAHAISDSDVT